MIYNMIKTSFKVTDQTPLNWTEWYDWFNIQIRGGETSSDNKTYHLLNRDLDVQSEVCCACWPGHE